MEFEWDPAAGQIRETLSNGQQSRSVGSHVRRVFRSERTVNDALRLVIELRKIGRGWRGGIWRKAWAANSNT